MILDCFSRHVVGRMVATRESATLAKQLIAATCAQTLDAAFAANPTRFKGKRPTPKLLPAAVWINPPAVTTADPGEPPEQH